MDADEALKRIREAAEAGRITYASQDGVDSFSNEFVDEFLSDICGVSSAWISDESSLSDFSPRDDGAHGRIMDKYGADVSGKDNLLDIFRVIHAQNRTPQ